MLQGYFTMSDGYNKEKLFISEIFNNSSYDDANITSKYRIEELAKIALNLDEKKASEFICFTLKLSTKKNQRDLIRSLWRIRKRKPNIITKAIYLILNDQPSDFVVYFMYLHFSRNLMLEDVLNISHDNLIRDTLLASGALHRAYILNKCDDFNFLIKKTKKENKYKNIKSSIIDPLTNKKTISSLSIKSQLEFIEEKNSKSHDELLGITQKKLEETLKDNTSQNSFIDSINKIRDSDNIAIVLKGPSLKNKKLGFIIDSHDLKIDVNFTQKGDSLVYGKNSDIHYSAAFLKDKKDFILFCGNKNTTEVKIRETLRDFSYNTPTTGFLVIIMVLLITKSHVSVFGFDSYSVRKQEYINANNVEKRDFFKTRNSAAPTHDIDYEFWFIHRFCKELLFNDRLSLF